MDWLDWLMLVVRADWLIEPEPPTMLPPLGPAFALGIKASSEKVRP